MPLAPGTRLGPYDILARIGAGGMGEVYRAFLVNTQGPEGPITLVFNWEMLLKK